MTRKFRIGEAAQIMNISTDTLRYYEEIGLIKPKRDEKTGYRYYEIFDLEILREIVIYRRIDISTEKIKDFFEIKKVNDLICYLEEEQKHVGDKMRELELIKSSMEKKIQNLKKVKMCEDRIIVKELKPYYFYKVGEFLEDGADTFSNLLSDYSELDQNWLAESSVSFEDDSSSGVVYVTSINPNNHPLIEKREIGLALTMFGVFDSESYFDKEALKQWLKENNYKKNGKSFVRKIHQSMSKETDSIQIYELIYPIKKIK